MDRVTLHDFTLKKPVHCPWCRATHTEALGIDTKDKPSPGDVFVCADCGQMSLWFGARDLRRPTYEEAKKALAVVGVAEVLVAWRLAHKTRGGH